MATFDEASKPQALNLLYYDVAGIGENFGVKPYTLTLSLTSLCGDIVGTRGPWPMASHFEPWC